ncbi:serine/threonine-protein kinase DCLK3 [Osmerus mordax]|uniref:serine/threonine-protein kinase DCLK3 n=1 Tax=Osmerus mordax TaxID=8014 RepID=UPI00351028A3
MMPAGRARFGCDAAGTRWRTAGAGLRTQVAPPFPLFHTRHAEQSAERPRLITVVRPCGQSVLRKVTVLLNRRGVVSYEQLLLDLSEALGFPRWHRARVTRLYTPHAREVKGVCDFFRGEVAFLAFGKARPDLRSVEEALEELFPEHSHYRGEALRAWVKRLVPKPDKDKASKADSGYSEGTDSFDTHAQHKHQTHVDADAHVRTLRNRQRLTQEPPLTDSHRQAKQNPDTQKYSLHNTPSNRHPVHPPNNLQNVRVRERARKTPLSVIGPFTQDEGLREETDISFPALCGNCRGEGDGNQEQTNHRAGRISLPPVSRKQRGHIAKEQEARRTGNCSHPRPINKVAEKSFGVLELFSSNTPQGEGSKEEVNKPTVIFDLPSDGSDVTLADIERCYDIGRVVGDGNFAIVRECYRRDNGETLAVKIVERSKLIGREHMMQNELSLLGSLSHPRVVRLLTHHHTHTHSYLIMELVPGGDLFDAIAERGKFPEGEARMMVSDMSEALRYIHSKRIVHRDLKPENLLVEGKGGGSHRLKLGDFGLAMVVTEPIFTVCGTPTYVAPEILSETGYGLTVDVWALGVVFYILLCGFPPFRSRDRDQEKLFQLIKQGELHFLSPYWDPISDGARSLVRALLQVDPVERLTAAEILQHPWVLYTATAIGEKEALPNTPQTTTDRQTLLQTLADQPKRAETRKGQRRQEVTSTDRYQPHQPSTGTSVKTTPPASASPQSNSNTDLHSPLNPNPTQKEPNTQNQLPLTNTPHAEPSPNSHTQPPNTEAATPPDNLYKPQAASPPQSPRQYQPNPGQPPSHPTHTSPPNSINPTSD